MCLPAWRDWEQGHDVRALVWAHRRLCWRCGAPAWGLPTTASQTARVQAPQAMSSSAARERRWRRCSPGPRHVAAAACHSTFGLKDLDNLAGRLRFSPLTGSTITYQE